MKPAHPCAGRPQMEVDAFDALATGHDPPPVPDAEHQAALDALARDGLIVLMLQDAQGSVYGIPIPIADQWADAMGVSRVPPPSGCDA